MTYDFSQSQNLPDATWPQSSGDPKRSLNVDPERVNYAKKMPESRKTAEKTSAEPGSQPGDIQIATESIASICKLCCTPRKVERTHHSFIRFSKLSCRMLLQVLIFSKIIQDPFEIWKWPKLAD